MSGEPLALLTGEQIREIVSDELAAVLAEHHRERPPAPLLVSGQELGRLLGCSRSKIHELRQQGMPSVRLGDCHKFEPAAALAWLKSR